MQSVTSEERNALESYAKVTMSVACNGVPGDAGVSKVEFQSSCGDGEAFSFGNACAAGITLQLDGAFPDIKGNDISANWTVLAGYDNPLFTGKVESAVVSAGRTTVVAWDRMYYDGSDIFVPSSALKVDVNAADAFSEIAELMGVSADATSLSMLEGVTIYGGFGNLKGEISLSAAAGYIAGLVGGNAIINRRGSLAIRDYVYTDITVKVYSGSGSARGSDFSITGITLQRTEMINIKGADGTINQEEQTKEFSAGDGTLLISNPLADQRAADRAYGALQNLKIRPGSYTFPGGLLLEPGDLFYVSTMDGIYTVVAAEAVISIDGGVRTTVSCGGWPETGGAAGQINQALATLVADYARLRSLVVENADIVNARISNLRAEDIVAGVIRSEDYEAVALQMIYPSATLYPGTTLYPNTGEHIQKGFEIDFANRIIRGVFFSEVTDALEQRIRALEEKLA